MNSNINYRSARILLSWCKKKYGPSDHVNVNSIKIKLDPRLDAYGQYFIEKETICLNPAKHRSLVSWCNTIIHEYTHVKQDMHKYYSDYGNRYKSHPFEIKANYLAKRDQLEARRYLMEKLSVQSK